MRDNVVPFPRTKMLRTKLRLVQYDDVRLEFARLIERRLDEMESVMAGEDLTPCDSQPKGAA